MPLRGTFPLVIENACTHEKTFEIVNVLQKNTLRFYHCGAFPVKHKMKGNFS